MFAVFISLASGIELYAQKANDSVSPNNPFRELYSREEYDKRTEAADKFADEAIRLAAETNYPTTGLKFTSIVEGANIDKAGVQKGSILYQRGDRKSWARYLPYRVAMPGLYNAHFYGPDGNEQPVDLEPGLFGARISRVYRPDIAYLRNEIGKRDPKWDRYLIIAGASYSSNAKLTETALHHAIEAGYRQDALTDFFQVLFKTFSREGPVKEMEKFLSHFEGKEIPWVYVPPLQRVLLVTGRIDFMQRIAEQAGDNCAFDAPVLEKFRQWTEGQTKWPEESLLDRAVAKRGDSIADIFTSSRREGSKLYPADPVDGALRYSTPPGSSFHIEFVSDKMPHNIHFHTTLKLKATGIDRKWQTKFRIDWAYLYPDGKKLPVNPRFPSTMYWTPARRFLHLSLGKVYSNSVLEVSALSLPGYTLTHETPLFIPFVKYPILPEFLVERFEESKDILAAEPKTMEIDMIRYHNEIGIFIDGICYLHLPTNPHPSKKIDLNMRSQGMNVAVEKQDVWELR